MRLSELRTGDKGVIVKVMGRGAFRKRIIEMGFIRGKEVIDRYTKRSAQRPYSLSCDGI